MGRSSRRSGPYERFRFGDPREGPIDFPHDPPWRRLLVPSRLRLRHACARARRRWISPRRCGLPHRPASRRRADAPLVAPRQLRIAGRHPAPQGSQRLFRPQVHARGRRRQALRLYPRPGPQRAEAGPRRAREPHHRGPQQSSLGRAPILSWKQAPGGACRAQGTGPRLRSHRHRAGRASYRCRHVHLAPVSPLDAAEGPRHVDGGDLREPHPDLRPRGCGRARPRGEVVVSMKKICIAALVVSAACASSPRPRELKLTADGFRTDGARWSLDPIERDKLMPEGWERVPGSDEDPTIVFLHFKRVQLDGDAWLVAWKLEGPDQRKNLKALSERGLTGFRLASGDLLFGTVEPAKPVLVDGAEAQEGIYEMRRRDDYSPITRLYIGFAKSLANDALAQIYFSSPPGQFDEGLEAARSLMRRLHFPSVRALEADPAASRGAQR